MSWLILQGPPNKDDLSPVVLLTGKNGPYPGRHFCSPIRQDLIWPHICSFLVNHIWPPGNPYTCFVSINSGSAGPTQHKRNSLLQLASPNPILSISQARSGRRKFHRAPKLLSKCWDWAPRLLFVSRSRSFDSTSLMGKGHTAHRQLFPKRSTPKILSHAPHFWLSYTLSSISWNFLLNEWLSAANQINFWTIGYVKPERSSLAI